MRLRPMVVSRVFGLVIVSALILACNDDDGMIEVRIVSEGNRIPIAGAVVEGGMDWDQYWVTTDKGGYAMLPPQAAYWLPTITANNHFPWTETHQLQHEYRLRRTPLHVTQAGTTYGKFVVAQQYRFSMLGRSGEYLVHRIDGDQVQIESGSRLINSAVGSFVVRDDTMWCAVPDSGVYGFDITDLTHPQRLFRIDIPNCGGALCLRDTLLYVATSDQAAGISTYDLRAIDGLHPLGTFGPAQQLEELSFHRNALMGTYMSNLMIWDLSDPIHGTAVFQWRNRYFSHWFSLGDSLVPVPWVSLGGDYYAYNVLLVHDPLSPIWEGEFHSEGRIKGFLSDTLAFGEYVEQGALMLKYDGGTEYYTAAVLGQRGDVLENSAWMVSDDFVIYGHKIWHIDAGWPD